MTSGQELSQVFLTGLVSGQQGILSAPMPDMSDIAAVVIEAIAFSAATVLTGAISNPSKAASDKNRRMAGANFILR